MSDRVLHCWFDFDDAYCENPYTDEECRVPGHTCMLERDHDGPHEPTRDDEIVVGFVVRARETGETEA